MGAVSTAALPAYTLNAVRTGKTTCPECEARQVSAVTRWGIDTGDVVTVKFDCSHEAITRPLRVTAGVKQVKADVLPAAYVAGRRVKYARKGKVGQ